MHIFFLKNSTISPVRRRTGRIRERKGAQAFKRVKKPLESWNPKMCIVKGGVESLRTADRAFLREISGAISDLGAFFRPKRHKTPFCIFTLHKSKAMNVFENRGLIQSQNQRTGLFALFKLKKARWKSFQFGPKNGPVMAFPSLWGPLVGVRWNDFRN